MSELLLMCNAASAALKSYAYGNSSPDLARDIAMRCGDRPGGRAAPMTDAPLNFARVAELIGRLTVPTGPDLVIDAEIGALVGDEWPRYTTSIDAAVKLCPSGYRWYVADSDDRSDGKPVAACFTPRALLQTGNIPRSVGAIPAIATEAA